MHCRVPAAFHSEASSDARRDIKLESEMDQLRFRLGSQSRPQIWDVMLRSLTRSPSTYPQQCIQYLGDEQKDCSYQNQQNVLSSETVKRSKTNSERGRAFRARRKEYEDNLETIVSSLRREVADLDLLCSVRADKALCSRNSMNGSPVRLIKEYFALFERGVPSVRSVGQKRPTLLTDGSSMNDSDDSFMMKQKAFLESAMDMEVQFNGANGPSALLDQWKRYSSYHSSIHVEVVGVEVSGEDDNPIVTVHLDLRVVFSRATFNHVFPHVRDNEELVNKFVGREVVYHNVNQFQFSSRNKILVYDSDVGFVDALVRAGANVSDIALLMQQALIADGCRLGNEDVNNCIQEPEGDDQDGNNCSTSEGGADGNDDIIKSSGSDAEEMSSVELANSRLAIDFLLS